MPSDRFDQRTQHLLSDLQTQGVYKPFEHLTGPLGATATLEGRGEVIVLCSNNYLGLANAPEVVAAGRDGLDRYGAGTASVRFICGTLDCHRQLEQRIARFVGCQAALTYVSCWNANEAAIATLVGNDDAILSDELNHASIIDGCRLARPGERHVYRHADLDDLEAKLKATAQRQVRWVITDGVFSMEGAVADLGRILDLCSRYDAMFVLDDSHGIGVLGDTGRGTPEHAQLLGQIDVITGTLGKALGGAAGGYVAGSTALIELLKQRSRPSLFSNALPATVACSADKAIELVETQPQLLERLRHNIHRLREGLGRLGFTCEPSPSAIIPIHIGDAAQAIRQSQRLLELGVWVVAFAFPVVPEGQARLRVQASAALSDDHIDRALDAFARL